MSLTQLMVEREYVKLREIEPNSVVKKHEERFRMEVVCSSYFIQNIECWKINNNLILHVVPLQESYIQTDLRRLPELNIEADTYIECNILNVVDSNEFHCILTSDIDRKMQLNTDLQQAFGMFPRSSNKVLSPRKDMICAIEIEHIWYRCRISKRDGAFEAYLVDEGRTVKVSKNWNELQYLGDEFFGLSQLSFKGRLEDVAGLDVLPEIFDAFEMSKSLYFQIGFADHETCAYLMQLFDENIRWPMPKLCMLKDFVAILEHVDIRNENLILYLHTIEEASELAEMSREMDDSQQLVQVQVTDATLNWKPNEIVIAAWDDGVKKTHYRGIIEQIHNITNECTVYFVDYGNSSRVHFTDISRYVMYTHKPIILTKLKLSNVKPANDKWTEDAVEELTDYIGQALQILIDSETTIPMILSGVAQVLESGMDLGEILFTKGHAAPADN